MDAELARRTGAEVIISGGVSSMADIPAAAERISAGIGGAILGKALYEWRLQLADALEAARAKR